ncbi:hypothetical protein O181_011677 [Austropuccinia psidii MF-1]|uniref:Uncharacterized protein n=1 Tax=Austropuccinia psidii MF-1 TaxID=1389203 RepID=A0A9Q3BW59_9BASI|nr:hypothetical protein [Austropuccinia psidii MF-1]
MGPTTYLQAKVGPTEPNLDPNLISPTNGQEPCIGHFKPLASGNYQRPPHKSQQGFPFIQGKDFSSPMYSVPWIQEWCIYGIIYNYAPILVSNPMMIFSGPNHFIRTPVLKYITHLEGIFLSHSVLKSLEATRRPFEDANHLALQELGCTFLSGFFQGQSKEVIKHSISCHGIKYFSIPWTN